MHALDAVVEVFTWVGLGAGLLALLVASLAQLADGVWVPTAVVLEDADGGRVARWFSDDGGVGEARLTHEQEHALAGKDAAEVYTRAAVHDRIRLTRRSPAVRSIVLLGVGLLTLGIAAVIVSLTMLFTRG
ncbi:hypothetical protein [Microbacterium ulmi]|uniref:Uncharacterized protein n=1 Tax=Microbacterium ulmi TaxID=179095 RepID=A0A7Y2M5E4_9MICO|nr:hypothetical protein [Microbacterium ulmi]NII68546.1 hypothetical protein [Microbacterium ulmi]NNH05418.1 hypothetical protein [Microbacterium ulmi]